MSTVHRVLLMANASAGFDRQLLRGVGLYNIGQSDTLFRHYDSSAEDHLSRRLIETWRPTGIISLTRSWSPALAAANSMGIPIVQAHETDDAVESLPVPSIFTDGRLIARVAVDYFVGRGLGSIGYVGSDRGLPRRHAAYVRDEADRRGLAFDCYHGEVRGELDPDLKLRKWLTARPRRTGLLASSDWYAGFAVGECLEAGLNVPDDIAVIGVSDDSPWCELAPVPLTSIVVAAEKIGYRAASILWQMMRGEAVPAGPIEIPPTGIVSRRSTDVIAAEDPDIAAALRFIHDHAAGGCTVKEVLQAVAIDRRRLERWCRTSLGRSPLDEIQRLRISNLKRLLAETDERIEELARMAGFGSAGALCRAFHRETGQTVAQYRRQFKKAQTASGRPPS